MYNNKTKAGSRTMLFEQIAKHFKNYSTLRILCLPGQKALEIFEIYDKLGVSRKNIVCLERNELSYKEILKLDLQCEILNQSFEEYVVGCKKVFDIVSLDFMGELGTFVPSLKNMIRNKLLAKKAILYTNFCGSREKDTTKRYYMMSKIEELSHEVTSFTIPLEEIANFLTFSCRDRSKYITNTIKNIIQRPILYGPRYYTEEDINSFSYIGDSTPMFSDVFLVKQNRSKGNTSLSDRLFLGSENTRTKSPKMPTHIKESIYKCLKQNPCPTLQTIMTEHSVNKWQVSALKARLTIKLRKESQKSNEQMFKPQL